MMQAEKPTKWPGLERLAKEVVYLAAANNGHRKLGLAELEAVKAELRRALEPLLGKAETVADWTDDLHGSNHTALRKELDLWRR